MRPPNLTHFNPKTADEQYWDRWKYWAVDGTKLQVVPIETHTSLSLPHLDGNALKQFTYGDMGLIKEYFNWLMNICFEKTQFGCNGLMKLNLVHQK